MDLPRPLSFIENLQHAGNYKNLEAEARRNAAGLLACISALTFIYLALKNSGIYPTVFSDEYTYSKFSRLLPLSDSPIPSYAYLYIYSFTSYCGDSFNDCSKILNAVFFVSAIPFVYLEARKVAGYLLSIAVALLTALGPINSYTAYFMPESLYFLCFWILAWCILRIDAEERSVGPWFFAGAAMGILSLVKPHALFLIPALFVYIMYISFKEGLLFTFRPFKFALILFGVAICLKLLIGYSIAGYAGLSMFGSLYGSLLSDTSMDVDGFMGLLSYAYKSFQGHMMVIALLYGIPFVFGVTVILRQFLQPAPSSPIEKLSVFSLLVILNLIVVVSFFTASVADAGLYESPYRLHMRYYNFALPAFLILAAGSLNAFVSERKDVAALFLGFSIVLLSLYAAATSMEPYTPGQIDSPELRGLYVNTYVFRFFAILSIAALCIWFISPHIGGRVYMFLALPFLVITSAFFINHEQRNRLVSDVYDHAGMFTRQYLSSNELSKVLVVGSDPSGLFRSLYYLDNPEAGLQVIPPGSFFDVSKLSSDREWVLVVGDHSLPDKTLFRLDLNGFTLAHAGGSSNLDFRESNWPGIVSRTRGLSNAEPWGTWSSDDVVNIEFVRALPMKFELLLTAKAFGPNVGKEFVAAVGNSVSRFTLSAFEETRTLYFENPDRLRALSIKVPSVTSPKSLGLSVDDRRLGIGIVEIRFRPL